MTGIGSEIDARAIAAGMAGDLADMTAAILAGGLGTRLRSVVADRPKALAEVRGRPFLAHQLDILMAAGVQSVVLCTGYLGDQIEAAFGDAYGSMRLTYSRESAPLGTAGALRLALPLLQSDPVLVLNGDSICRTDLKSFWEWHRAAGAAASLLLMEVSDDRRYGRVQIDELGGVIGFVEKGQQSGPGWVNAGVYLLGHQVLQAIPAGEIVSLERDVFPLWAGRGLCGYRVQGAFLDIGTPETYAVADEFVTCDR
jgi:NDP-sugar pyrophosphorylase family protein